MKTPVLADHVGLKERVILDCRLKPWDTGALEADEATRQKFDEWLPQLLPPLLR
jgi:hypothetical protein